MNTVERQEGFKEKRAELTVQQIHPLGDGVSIGSSTMGAAAERNTTVGEPVQSRTPSAASRNTTTGVSVDSRTPEKVEPRANVVGVFPQSDLVEDVPQPMKPQVPNYPVPAAESDVDDIPF